MAPQTSAPQREKGADIETLSFEHLLTDCLRKLEQGLGSESGPTEPRIINRTLRRLTALRKAFNAREFFKIAERLFVPSPVLVDVPSYDEAAAAAAGAVDAEPIKDILSNNAKQLENNSQLPAPNVTTSDEATASGLAYLSLLKTVLTSVVELQNTSDLADDQLNEGTSKAAEVMKDDEVPITDNKTVEDSSSKKETTANSVVQVDFVKVGKSEETRVFMGILAIMALLDVKHASDAFPLIQELIQQVTNAFTPGNTHLDGLITAKAVFYIARVHEVLGNFHLIRSFLMRVYRSALLRQLYMVQAVAINLILRDLLKENCYDAAAKLFSKAPYPENLRSNGQHCRYLYYLARVQSMRMDYGDASINITQVLRKCPQDGAAFGRGFRLEAYKLSIVIQLLLGEIPPREIFNQKDIARDLHPYAEIVQAVRSGDVNEFNLVQERHYNVFAEDRNLNFVKRLRHSVISAGIRKINMSYSQISLEDITKKLGVKSVNDSHCIVAKAIADEVIDAFIDHDSGIVYAKEGQTSAINEPMSAYHGRIAFCLQMYNDAVKAMQYAVTDTKAKKQEAVTHPSDEENLDRHLKSDELDPGDEGDLI